MNQEFENIKSISRTETFLWEGKTVWWNLPKPTYVPNHDVGDINESKAKDEEDLPKSSTDKQLETINQMMNNLNLDKPMDINKLLNDEFQCDNTNTNNGKLMYVSGICWCSSPPRVWE